MIVEHTTLPCSSNAEGVTCDLLASFFYKHVTPSALKNSKLRNMSYLYRFNADELLART